MIGTTGATVLFLVNVFFAGALGIGAGGLTCLALRLAWGLKDTLIDAALAAAVAVVASYVIAAVESARGVWESSIVLILATAVAIVVLRHLLRLALRAVN